MILLELFYTFLIIGLFTFGGGYSMIALIQSAVVEEHGWLTAQEFADILAISQITPGPVGINTATYAGYSAVIAEGYPTAVAVAGALIASLAVLILPMTLILIVGRWLLAHKANPPFDIIFKVLRLTVIGLIAAAAISLMPTAFSPTPSGTVTLFNFQFSFFNLIIFLAVFGLSLWKKASPILLILLAGLVGFLIY
ncbi:MAG: chromate transporter [Bacteroidales bacterium]|nr:chromate transporter [Bacteroidales bacterium]